MKNEKQNAKVGKSAKERVDFAILNDGQISREEIKEGLKKDIEGVCMTISELLRSTEAMEALTEVFWQRYQKYHREKMQTRIPGFVEQQSNE